MKLLTITLLLLSSNIFSGLAVADNKIKNDVRICGAYKNGNFKKILKNLDKYYNTTLKESYFDIECMGGDLLGLTIDSPSRIYFASVHLQKHFEKDEKIPVMFSEILLHKVDGKDVLRRIKKELTLVRDGVLAGTEYETKLVKLQTKYIAYLEKYPVPGSVESVNAAKQWEIENYP